MGPRILLSTLGGFGDTLMLSMPARRIRQLYPDAHITVQGQEGIVDILGSNPDINEIRIHFNWHDIPVNAKRYDVIIDFRYGVKTFYIAQELGFDVPAQTILRRQRKHELALWVNDIPTWRMKRWQWELERWHAQDLRFPRRWTNALGWTRPWRWTSITSYLSGLNYTPDDLYIHREPVRTLPEEFVAVSSPTPIRGVSKLWPSKHWNRLFAMFPSVKFILLGTAPNMSLSGITNNVIHAEGKFNLFQTADIIAKAKVLVSEEGGLVHIARAVCTRSIVLFGSTQVWFFGYPENENLYVKNTDCRYCHNQYDFWAKRCMKNSKTPFCMNLEALKPEVVGESLQRALNRGKGERK